MSLYLTRAEDQIKSLEAEIERLRVGNIKMAAEVVKLRAERAELLTALRYIEPRLLTDEDRMTVRAVIVKAEGGK
jgi:hypothetical protein